MIFFLFYFFIFYIFVNKWIFFLFWYFNLQNLYIFFHIWFLQIWIADTHRVFISGSQCSTNSSKNILKQSFLEFKMIVISRKFYAVHRCRKVLKNMFLLVKHRKLINLKLQYLYFQRLWRHIRYRVQRLTCRVILLIFLLWFYFFHFSNVHIFRFSIPNMNIFFIRCL